MPQSRAPRGNVVDRYVYVLLDVTDGRVCKIGSAYAPEMRLKTCQVSNWHLLRLDYKIMAFDACRLEREVRRALKPFALLGEWFRVSVDEAIATIVQTADRLEISLFPEQLADLKN